MKKEWIITEWRGGSIDDRDKNRYLLFMDPVTQNPVWADLADNTNSSMTDAKTFPTKKEATHFLMRYGFPYHNVETKEGFRMRLIMEALS